MQKMALMLLFAALTCCGLMAQTYEVNQRLTDVEPGTIGSGVSYDTYYHNGENDFIVGNTSTTRIVAGDNFYTTVEINKAYADRDYVAAEVCYDFFAYEPSTIRGIPFKLTPKEPQDNGDPILRAYTYVTQIRLSQPIAGSPGQYQVIYDLPVSRPTTDGYQCVTANFPAPYSLPKGTIVNLRLAIDKEAVIRIDQIKLME